LCCNVRNRSSQAVDDDDDYIDRQLTDDDDDVIDDVITGRLMTCTGLVEMPSYLPPGETQLYE